MTSNRTVIQVEHLTKVYQLAGKKGKGYNTLREAIYSSFKNILPFNSSSQISEAKNKFRAIDDISFNVEKGEILGIIGMNGAGKSTLLKLIGRVTPPTEGIIKIKGRLASLLEVGTGFHPELTGRENIFLSGTILGMRRAEIKKSLSEIIAFSGIEKFIDVPVKRYSSGMYVRLGFSIAAHLRAEILLIDEILAVGDIDFQKKCLEKISDVSKDGRTVLFVSHNLETVDRLCNQAILLSEGKILFKGKTDDAISNYVQKSFSNYDGAFLFENQAINKIQFSDLAGQNTINLDSKSGISIQVEFESKNEISYPVLGLVIKNKMKTPIIAINNRNYSINFTEFHSNKGTFKIQIEEIPLISGEYYIDLYLGDINGDFEVLKDCANFFFINNSAPVQNVSSSNNIILLDKVEWDLVAR